jgi:hypothetical protein
MGTVRYMSPEQVRGQEVDGRSDLYSLAVTLYESLCGVTPFDGESHFEIMASHLTEVPPCLAQQDTVVPPALEALIASGLAKQPEERPASAQAMRRSLEEVLASDPADAAAPDAEPVPPRAARPTQGPRPARPLLWLLLGGLALGAGAVAALLVSNRGSERRPPRAAPAMTARDPDWPAPHVISGLDFAVDQRFDGDRLRVMSVSARDTAEVRSMVLAAQRDFAASAAAAGVNDPVLPQPLTVIIVPQATLCDPRIDERGRPPAGCESAGSWYRPREKTLYLADDESDLGSRLAYAVAVGMCLHSDAAGCDGAARLFEPAERKRAAGN